MNSNEKNIMPPSASLTFYYKKMEVCSVPTFALSIIAMQGELSAKDYDDVNRIENFSDWITEGKTDKNEMEYISLLRRIIPWATLSQYIDFQIIFIHAFVTTGKTKRVI
jgi:hypothetical protein